MTALTVRGGQPLQGRIDPSANKNAVLPVLCATLLTDGKITLRNVPEITDVTRIHGFFAELGSTVHWDKTAKVLKIDHSTISAGARATLPQAMRAAIDQIRAGTPVAAALEQLAAALLDGGFSAVDYAEVRDAESLAPLPELGLGPARLLVAARIGGTRLIDNMAV